MQVVGALFVLSLVTYASASFSFAHRNPPHPDCADHGKYITEHQVNEMNTGRATDNSIFRAHLVCVWKEKGAMNENGIFQKNYIKSNIAPQISNNPSDIKTITNCAVQKSSPGESAYAFYKCIAPILAH
ncbi:hypothetical protein HHI36_009644 [Cryptolaemus montrouzieri]|uniref:Uncharacterized protein n=1 Tax=Cryptolaemus montrouzieri TaxID=559131 RepID=A0ABD2MGE6_9CUCU